MMPTAGRELHPKWESALPRGNHRLIQERRNQVFKQCPEETEKGL